MHEMTPALTPLLTANQIQTRTTELARAIEENTQPEITIHLVGVLTGSFMFLADLARSFKRPVTIEFVRYSSYRNGTEPVEPPVCELKPRRVSGRHVLIVEDIVDTGETLHALHTFLATLNPQTLRTVCLLDKPTRRRRHVPVEFIGFTIEDIFVVGYGLDHADQYRSLPHIVGLR
jgi:hypoxanthine phosphoribosyltransferase